MRSPTARQGLNGLTFFIAAVQSGFGPFIAVYLTEQGWSQTDIGVALSIGTATAIATQVPSGVLVDHVHNKRGLTAASLVMLGLAALLLTAWPAQGVVWTSQIIHAATSGILTPAIAALTLALCGHDAFSARLGVNARYLSLGNAIGAALLGVVASTLSNRAVFALTAVLVIPALLALLVIRPDHYADPDNDHPSMQHPRRLRERSAGPWHIFELSALHIFAVCIVLFALANAAMLPLALNALTIRTGDSGLVVSGAIVMPQIVAALIAPWIGSAAQQFGRRPVLIAGFLVLPLRGLLLATQPGAIALAMMQTLDGVSASVLGIMVPLIAADVTRRTGYLNSAIGSLGLASSLGATFSTTLGGLVADRLGVSAALLGLAAVGLAATFLLWIALPETRPEGLGAVRPSSSPA